jgi:hypothetical protein
MTFNVPGNSTPYLFNIGFLSTNILNFFKFLILPKSSQKALQSFSLFPLIFFKKLDKKINFYFKNKKKKKIFEIF